MKKHKVDKNSRLLKKSVAVSLSIALLIGILIVLLNIFGDMIFTKKLEFDNCADFKAFMESDYDRWLEEGYRYYDADGNLIIEIPMNPEIDDIYGGSDGIYYPDQEIGVIKNSSGDVICEYYYNPNLYRDIVFNDISSDRMPVTVITSQAHYDSVNWEHNIESVLYFLLAADFVATACIYLFKIRKNKNQDRR